MGKAGQEFHVELSCRVSTAIDVHAKDELDAHEKAEEMFNDGKIQISDMEFVDSSLDITVL